MSEIEESAEAGRREYHKMIIRTFRPYLWQKLALGLKIPKGWDGLFDIEKEQADLNEVLREGISL